MHGSGGRDVIVRLVGGRVSGRLGNGNADKGSVTEKERGV